MSDATKHAIAAAMARQWGGHILEAKAADRTTLPVRMENAA